MARSTRTTRLLGHDVVVDDAGSGPDAVVLVHGIGVSSRYFGPLCEVLARTGRVLTPDLPGFGRSRPERVLSVEEHAAVIVALIDESGLDRPVVLGHSMGAQIVAEVAVQRPGLVDRVVLVGPVVEPGARSAARQAWRLVRDYRFEQARANLITATDWLRCGPRRYAATLPTMMGYPLEDRVADVAEEVLLVRGEHDPVAPLTYLELLASRCRKPTVVEVRGEGHIAMYRRPEAVAAVCREVLC